MGVGELRPPEGVLPFIPAPFTSESLVVLYWQQAAHSDCLRRSIAPIYCPHRNNDETLLRLF